MYTYNKKLTKKAQIMFINVFASGTNIQRIAKNAGGKKIHGYVDASYTELEETDKVVSRKNFMLTFAGLYDHLKNSDLGNKAFTSDNNPNWSAIWLSPLKCKDFITTTFKAMVGQDDHLASLNLSTIANEELNTFMVWTSANNNQLTQIKKMLTKAIPDYRIIVLSGGEGITQIDAQTEVQKQIKYAKEDGQIGIIVLAKMMGSRSFSVSEIQANVLMYDGGSIDATSQKVSRSLTGGENWDGDVKETGYTFSFSYDNNRSENIESLLLYEALSMSRSTSKPFNETLPKVAMSMNIWRADINGNPTFVEVTELVKIFSEDENILKIADVTYDIEGLLNSTVFDILSNIKVGKNNENKKKIDKLVPKRTGTGTKPNDKSTPEEKDIKKIEQLINLAIKAINRSATTVYNIANTGNDYRDCLNIISKDPKCSAEFIDFYTVTPIDVIQLIDENILNVPLLDIIVEHSKNQDNWLI